MAKNDPSRNAGRNSARGAVLLCAPPLFRRSAQKSQFWNIRLQVCHQSVAHRRKFIRGVSASERRDGREPGLAGLYSALRPSHTFFYLDPPYWQMAGYDIPFEFEQYERMAEVMRNCHGKMMVSINDHPERRRVFAGFPERTLQTTYTLNGRSRSEKRRECVVMSWEASV